MTLVAAACEISRLYSETHPPPYYARSDAAIRCSVGAAVFVREPVSAVWAELSVHVDVWIADLAAMRREIDSIVRQVIQLMQRGDLDPSLKEDVMVVLRALRRRSAVTQQAATGDEAYLESAAAMLHFCRLVLRLSETAIDDK